MEEELLIRNARVFSKNEVLVELSDGRSLTLSLHKILTLAPDDVLVFVYEIEAVEVVLEN